MKLKKITFATPHYMYGMGIENRITQLATHLGKDIQTEIICIDYSRMPPRDIKIRRVMAPLRFLMKTGAWKHTKLFQSILNAYFGIFGVNVVDAQYTPMTGLKGAKKIITWHSVTYREMSQNIQEGTDRTLEFESMIKHMKSADLIIPVSKWAESEVKRYLPKAKTKVVYNGVDLDKYRYHPEKKHRKVLLSVGRFAPHKSHEEVIAVFLQVLKRHPDAELVIGGFNPDEKYFKKFDDFMNKLISLKSVELKPYFTKTTKSEEEKKVEPQTIHIYTDKKESSDDQDLSRIGKKIRSRIHIHTDLTENQMPLLYQEGDVFLSCSHWEGFGMCLIEAQASGLPSFAYDICSHPEVVANQDHLAAENDLFTLAERISDLFDDEKEYTKQSQRARTFSEQFAWQKIAKEYLDAVKSC